jgi:hypothetical protein
VAHLVLSCTRLRLLDGKTPPHYPRRRLLKPPAAASPPGLLKEMTMSYEFMSQRLSKSRLTEAGTALAPETTAEPGLSRWRTRELEQSSGGSVMPGSGRPRSYGPPAASAV